MSHTSRAQTPQGTCFVVLVAQGSYLRFLCAYCICVAAYPIIVGVPAREESFVAVAWIHGSVESRARETRTEFQAKLHLCAVKEEDTSSEYSDRNQLPWLA